MSELQIFNVKQAKEGNWITGKVTNLLKMSFF